LRLAAPARAATKKRIKNKDLDTIKVPTVPVCAEAECCTRLSMVEWALINESRCGNTPQNKKNRQAPGGERLPSHQKSHQTLGGVRLLAGLLVTYARG
jgi:hypothetical protein